MSDELRVACLIAVIAAISYLSLLSINYDSNGIVTARGIENGDVLNPNHTLFELIGVGAVRVAALWDHQGPSFPILQILAAVAGSLTLGLTYLTGRQLGAERLPLIAAITWLGTTWSFWRYSTNVAYITTGAMLAVAAMFLLWYPGRPSQPILAGVVAALSILAWEANISLLPALIFGAWIQSQSPLLLLAGCGFTLLVAYISMAAFSGIRNVTDLIQWIASYGSGSHMPSWGQWGFSRLGQLAKTWVYSTIGGISTMPQWPLARPIRFDTVFPKLAPLALAAFFLLSLILTTRSLKNRVVQWCAIGILAYVPFLVWWDPFEPKWLLVPNTFLALLGAWLYSQNHRTSLNRLYIAAVAVAVAVVLAIGNISRYGIPEHFRLNENYQVGDCVGRRLAANDLFIAVDWRWGDYMSYKHRRDSIDLISAVVSFNLDKEAALRDLRARIRQRQQSGGDVYMTDPSLVTNGPEAVGVTRQDLESLSGKIAFRCSQEPIRKLDPILH